MATIDDVYNLLVTVDGKIDVIDANVDAIKAKTDSLTFTGSDVHATLDGEEVATDNTTNLLGPERFADFTESSY